MGVEYYFYNHQNATIFELGRGPWHVFSNQLECPDNLNLLRELEPDLFVEVLKEEWGDYFERSSEEEMLRYFRLLTLELQRFIKDTPDTALLAAGDSGDERMWADYLNYKYVGSRYALGDSDKNKQYIEDENTRSIDFRARLSLSEFEIENLKQDGWNLRNLK